MLLDPGEVDDIYKTTNDKLHAHVSIPWADAFQWNEDLLQIVLQKISFIFQFQRKLLYAIVRGTQRG